MLPDHPPRPVLRHRQEQRKNEECHSEGHRKPIELPAPDIVIDGLTHDPMQHPVVERTPHPGQPRDAVLHSLVSQPVARPTV